MMEKGIFLGFCKNKNFPGTDWNQNAITSIKPQSHSRIRRIFQMNSPKDPKSLEELKIEECQFLSFSVLEEVKKHPKQQQQQQRTPTQERAATREKSFWSSGQKG